jgi:glucose/arabinose dehydrogenase
LRRAAAGSRARTGALERAAEGCSFFPRALHLAGALFGAGLLVAVGALPCAAADAPKSGEELVGEEIGHRLRPRVVDPTADRIKRLRLPYGFRVQKFAQDLGTPRMLRVGDDGTVYVTRPDEGDVLALRDEDGDGRAEKRGTLVRELAGVHDLAVVGDTVYFVTVEEAYRARRSGNRLAGLPERFLTGLPEGGRHPNRTIALGPDGSLYVSIGSTCNCCVEEHPEAAAIIRFAPDGSRRELFASGLRNTIGFDWHPKTGDLWGMDHNTDWLGDDFPPEELNLLQAGKSYGWPWVHGEGVFPPGIRYPKDFDRARALESSTKPVLMLKAHSAPIQLVFYEGTRFPEAYRDDAFVAAHGSWNRKPPGGYEVVRVSFENGRPVAFEPFLTGFLDAKGEETFGRPTGVAVAKDGSLLVGDDETGVIYRIDYAGPEQG